MKKIMFHLKKEILKDECAEYSYYIVFCKYSIIFLFQYVRNMWKLLTTHSKYKIKS